MPGQHQFLKWLSGSRVLKARLSTSNNEMRKSESFINLNNIDYVRFCISLVDLRLAIYGIVQKGKLMKIKLSS